MRGVGRGMGPGGCFLKSTCRRKTRAFQNFAECATALPGEPASAAHSSLPLSTHPPPLLPFFFRERGEGTCRNCKLSLSTPLWSRGKTKTKYKREAISAAHGGDRTESEGGRENPILPLPLITMDKKNFEKLSKYCVANCRAKFLPFFTRCPPGVLPGSLVREKIYLARLSWQKKGGAE